MARQVELKRRHSEGYRLSFMLHKNRRNVRAHASAPSRSLIRLPCQQWVLRTQLSLRRLKRRPR